MSFNFEEHVKQVARDFYINNKKINPVKLLDINGEVIKCECGNTLYKLYRKFGGITYGKYNKIMNNVPIRYNFVCKCGNRLVLVEGTFSYGKIKFGCSAGICTYGKKSMDKKCLSCKYLYQK